MKKILVGSALFLGGYFIGFYEMKYKMMKIIIEESCKKAREESE